MHEFQHCGTEDRWHIGKKYIILYILEGKRRFDLEMFSIRSEEQSKCGRSAVQRSNE